MNIVFLVASNAHAGRLLHKELFDMALLAFQLTVFLYERITGLFRVIKIIPFPGLRGMTDLALFPEMPLVIVVFYMTVVTNLRGVLEQRRFVTFGTANIPMFVQKLKTRFLMIEFLNVLPSLFRMTGLAGIAQLTLMLVVRAMTRGALTRNLVGFLDMAFRAGNIQMLPDERIVRFRMIKTDSLPLLGRMATGALPSQFAFVVIVVLMALDACFRGRFHVRSFMTFQAFDGLMFSDQRKPGLVVVEQNFLPILHRVTLRALGTEDSLMTVDTLMALDAGLRRFTKLRGFMAFIAFHLAMASQQFKFGFVMVKDNGLPILHGMTALALLAQNPFVLVLIQMTSETGRRGCFEVIGGVAFFTRHRSMFPFQRKLCAGMVEADLFPCLRVMATLAGLSQRPFVFIFLGMAGITIMGGFAKLWFQMAPIAFGGLMLAGQFELRLSVVEMGGIKLDDMAFAPLVFRVAGLAPGGVGLSVEAGLQFDIFFDFLVTGQAFIEEYLLDKIMAVQTTSFRFFVSPGNLARHHTLQDVECVGHAHGCEKQYENPKADFFPHQASRRSQQILRISIRRRHE